MGQYGVSGLLVEEDGKKLAGIITRRDITFEKNLQKQSFRSHEQRQLLLLRDGTTIDEAKEILHNHRIEKLPVIDDKKRIVGLITSKDILKMDQYPYASKDKKG